MNRFSPAFLLLAITAPMVLTPAAGRAADLTDNEITSGSNPSPGNITFGTTSKSGRFDPPAESVELDNGMIIKWGAETVTALTTSTTVNFNEAFPNGTLSVEVSVDAASALSGTSATVRSYTASGFIIDVQCTSGLGGIIACTSDTDVSWSARGY